MPRAKHKKEKVYSYNFPSRLKMMSQDNKTQHLYQQLHYKVHHHHHYLLHKKYINISSIHRYITQFSIAIHNKM